MMKQNHLTWRMLSLSIVMGLMCLMGNNAEAQFVCNDTVFPFLETFDSGVDSLVCWQPLEGSNWQLIQPGTGSGNGPNKSMVSSSEYANVDSWIVSKAIALPADTTMPLVLSWDVSATHYMTYYYRYFVLVSTGDWTDRTSYDTVYADSSMQVYCGNENTSFENRMVNLDAYRGQTIHVAFCNHPLYADPYEGHWMRLNIDNVEVREGDATVVDNIQVAIVGASTTWVGDTMHYVATITGGDTDAFTYTWHSSLLDTTMVTFNPRLTLTYPAAGTDNLTVSFAEGTAVYSATLVIAVQAPCGIIESFPYFEGFEGYGWENREGCWQMRLRRGDYMFNHWRRSTMFHYEGEYGFYSTANETEGGADAWLITPAIELPADSVVLLDFFLESSYLSNFAVLLSPTGDSWYDAFTDTLYRESGGGYDSPWNSITLSLQNYRGRHVRMAFVHSGPASLSAVAIDNMMLRCQPNNDTIPDTVWHSVTVNRRCHNCYEDIPDDYVTGEGVYQDGSTVTLEGAVNGCSLSFEFWTDEVCDTIFDNPYSFVITSDRTLTAWFGMHGGIGEEENGKLKVEIYPNPAGNTVTIRANDDSPLRMAVMDMNGRVVLECRQDTSVPIDVSQLPRGAYFVRITTDEGTTVKKLIVK